MVADLRQDRATGLTWLEVQPWLETTAGSLWGEGRQSILNLLARLADADGGRHWRHTLEDLAIINVLMAGLLHPDWPQTPVFQRVDLINWLERQRQVVDPEMLRMFVFLHDIGKIVQAVGHEELSFRLLMQAIGRGLEPNTPEALLVLAVRYHGVLGSMEVGVASPVALLALIEAIQDYGLDLEQFLSLLNLLTITEFAVYRNLNEITLEGIWAQADLLRRYAGASGDRNQLRLQLWEEAGRQTFRRLSRLLLCSFERFGNQPHHLVGLQQAVEPIFFRTCPDPAHFQKRLALLWVEGGYDLFQYLAETISEVEELVNFGLPLLENWLPDPAQVAAFERGEVPFYMINLRMLGGTVAQKSLSQLQGELAQLKPIPWVDFLPPASAY